MRTARLQGGALSPRCVRMRRDRQLDGDDEHELLPTQGVAEGDLGQGLGTPGEDTGLGLVVIPEGERLDPDESE